MRAPRMTRPSSKRWRSTARPRTTLYRSLPEYNILKTTGSSLGYKDTSESIAKMRGRELSDETKAKISAELLKLGRAKPDGSGSPSKKNISFLYRKK
jgi:hypothetical protein